MSERHRLTWTVSPTPRPTLPDGVERMFLPSPDGLLELLVSLPKHYQAGRDSKPPLLFLHGGKIVSASWIIGFRFLRIGWANCCLQFLDVPLFTLEASFSAIAPQCHQSFGSVGIATLQICY